MSGEHIQKKWPLRGVVMLLCMLFLNACKDELLHNLNEPDANHILAKLHKSGVEADKVSQPDGRWAISVSPSQTIVALKEIDQSRILKGQTERSKKKSNLMLSRSDERFEYERNISAEIERTISSIAGVIEARVHLNLPPIDPLFGVPNNKIKSSASVLVVIDGSVIPQIAEIAALVSGAAGIEKENISVLINQDQQTETASNISANLSEHQSKDSALNYLQSLDPECLSAAALLIVASVAIIYFRRARKRTLVNNLSQKLATISA